MRTKGMISMRKISLAILALTISALLVGCGTAPQKAVLRPAVMTGTHPTAEESRDGVKVIVGYLSGEDLARMTTVATLRTISRSDIASLYSPGGLTTTLYPGPKSRLFIRRGPVFMEHAGIPSFYLDEYINYAEDENLDLLILDNMYKRYPWSVGYDLLGRSVLARGIEYSPFVDGEGNPKVTAFLVTVKNGRKDKIGLDMSDAVLVDDQGRQYRAISADDPSLIPEFYPWGPPIRNMIFARRAAAIRAALRSQLFPATRVFPGEKTQGILAFPKLPPDAKEAKVIIPEIKMFDNNEVIKVVDFEFTFKREEVTSER